MITEQNIAELKTNITGNVLLPGDAGYDEASTVLMAKGSPAVVVQPQSPADVSAAIGFAKAQKLVLSVRSGGHSGPAHSTNKGGLVIDLSLMKLIEVVDEAKHIVRIGAGAIWGDIGKELQKHGLAISSGDTRTVGVGGLTLAGGIGWMVRKYGLAIDSLVGVTMVLEDGTIVRASKDEYDDLFWAIRGGGGNFGVITSFEFAAHPVGDVYAGMIMYPLEHLGGLLKGWRDAQRSASEDVTTMFLVMPGNPAFPDMPKAVMILYCYAGDDEAAAVQAQAPFEQLGTPLTVQIQKKHYYEVLEDAHVPPGARVITNNIFAHQLSDELIDVIEQNSGQILQIRAVGGAMNRVPADATAFAHRDNEVLIVCPNFAAPDASDADIEKTLAPWRNIARFSNGSYVSLLTEVTPAEIAASYPPETYKKLAAIKQKYDPTNLFNQNYNIKPEA